MSNAPHNGPPGLPPDDAARLEELLADRAVFGLDSADDLEELDNLLAAAGHDDDFEADLIAASVATSHTAVAEPMPATLRERVLAAAPHKATLHKNEPASVASPRTSGSDPGQMGWKTIAMAVAAGLLVSLMINNLRPAPTPTLADNRAALIAEAGDLVQVAWAPQPDDSVQEGLEGDGAYGDVVWSDATQTGYMRFHGLKANDPTVEQYQLWVFDEARNAEHPVDGGVFDIAANTNDRGEVIVPIDAKLPITKATLFAITVEKPGGVVVSDRSRLPLLAQR